MFDFLTFFNSGLHQRPPLTTHERSADPDNHGPKGRRGAKMQKTCPNTTKTWFRNIVYTFRRLLHFDMRRKTEYDFQGPPWLLWHGGRVVSEGGLLTESCRFDSRSYHFSMGAPGIEPAAFGEFLSNRRRRFRTRHIFFQACMHGTDREEGL